MKTQVRPFGILAAGLTLVAIITALGGVWHYQSVIAQHPDSPSPRTAGVVSGVNTQSPSGTPASGGSKSAPNAASSVANKSASNPGVSAIASTPLPTAASTQNQAMATISLSVNGTHKGSITLASTSKQCEVLNQALKDGLISSLTMPYDSQYKTYGVYAIDGIGDPTTVWWTYQINGKSPPSGCSYLTVHDGDAVNWQYIKS